MAEKILQKRVQDLLVWSDNPRYGYGGSVVNEPVAINTLIDVVGETKMFALAKDIVDSGGLLGNTLPTIVEKDGRFLVYDGNRRISTIKVLLDPSIIDLPSYKAKIEKLVEGKDLSALEVVNVLLTDEENALRIMDGTHTGERGGAGLIPWDAYNRDISLDKRGQKVLYPVAFGIAKLLGYKKKKDFSIISYTDYQRLFSSNALKKEFGIGTFKESEKNNVEAAVNALLAYKDLKGFKSFSREFNTTKDSGESDLPISRFIAWHNQLNERSPLYIIDLEPIELFEGDEMPDLAQKIRIRRRGNDSLVNVDDSLLEWSFVDPVGRISTTINNRLIGEWKWRVIYDGILAESTIVIRKLDDPIVLFDNSVVEEGNSFPLKRCVSSAISSRRKSIIDSMRIDYVGNGNPSVVNGVLTGETKAGKYTFSFSFDNEGTPYSETHDIIVKPASDIIPILSTSSPLHPFVDILNIGPFSELCGIAEIAEEINESWEEGHRKLAVCGMRAVLELTLDEVSGSGEVNIRERRKLRQSLEDFVQELCDQSNGLLKSMSDLANTSFRTELNFLSSLNIDGLISALHIAAHKSSRLINENTIFEMCKKDLSHIVALAELLLRLHKNTESN